MAAARKHTEALIVGAGPAGLMMAAQLLRYGIRPTIIDRRTGPDKRNKALILQGRTLELFRQLGLANKILSNGIACEGIQIQEGKAVWAHVDFDQTTPPRGHFPALLTVSQIQVESVLTQFLTENTCAIRWETTLHALTQNDRGVRVGVSSDEGVETWRCDWVIGADGADSQVRQLAGIAVEVDAPMPIMLAEMQLEEGRNRRIHLFLSRGKQFLGLFPMDETGNYRFMGMLPRGTTISEGAFAPVKRWIDGLLGFELPVAKVRWSAEVTLRRQKTAVMRQQRCFLIGDAAHVFPYGLGLGLNIGMQEAANLGWKLAGVVRGRYKPETLFSYEQERAAAAARAMSMAASAWRVAADRPWTTNNWFWGAFRKRLQRELAKPRAAATLEADVAQWNVDYTASALSVHHSTQFSVRAGDRLPYLPLFDEKQQSETDLHAWCAKPGFILLVLGTVSHHNLRIIGQWMKQKYPRDMHLYYLPYSDRNKEVFDQFEMRNTMTKMVLVRPDMHIAYINDMLNTGLVDNYMETIMGWSYESSSYHAGKINLGIDDDA